ncbi:MAG: hypothetical protein M0Z98_04495, partial [Actinomycetales bacterium]|nr:hypothetical protein [Actinomycetales bacterium]
LTASAAGPGTAFLLTAATTAPVVADAIRWWSARSGTGVPRDLRVVVADLPGLELAEADGRTIRVDADAAGWGWSAAATVRPGRMDLLTVLAHEVGHVLGRGHEETGVMRATLEPGVRPRDLTPSSVVSRDATDVVRPVSATATVAAVHGNGTAAAIPASAVPHRSPASAVVAVGMIAAAGLVAAGRSAGSGALATASAGQPARADLLPLLLLLLVLGGVATGARRRRRTLAG